MHCESQSAPLGSARSGHAGRNSIAYGSAWMVAACLAVVSALFSPGCSGSSGAYAVDEPQARDALKLALDAWKKGETSRSLASSSSPMTVQDFEWDSGEADRLRAPERRETRGLEPAGPGEAHDAWRTRQGEERAQTRREKGFVRGRHEPPAHRIPRYHETMMIRRLGLESLAASVRPKKWAGAFMRA